ncbi:MAG: tRNA epoxyqueuosine(34) reductase QueG [Alloprevotella sp.]|nr:tRNA epoxyqueuosine(34) reductase QueG [Prevotellamassilia sp.]MDY5763084.1 tRNA epoxyqueuosine(34) reductase QueG [Alloprevotella sp.]
MSHHIMLHSDQIKAEAKRLGFYAAGIAPAAPLDEEYARRYKAWLAGGHQADMAWIENNLEKRLNPCLLVEGAQTIVSVALGYYLPDSQAGGAVSLARYARGRDYHDVMRERLKALMAALGLQDYVDGRIFCDTAPIDERYWAKQCGLGWPGRSGQFIIPGAGTYFFLGELVLIHPADHYDQPATGRCGECRRCIDACPTGALMGDGTLDARRCLSYLTIEHRGELPIGTGSKMGSCFYGCDRCAEACPWNRFAPATAEKDFQPKTELKQMTTTDWQSLTIEDYRRLFKGSAVKRAGFEGLTRNIQALHTAEDNEE